MGSGFALDSVKGMQLNRALKQMRRVRYNEMKEAVSKIKSHYHKFHDVSNLSDQELLSYKKKIKNRIKRERIKTVSISTAVTLLLLLVIYVTLSFVYNYFFTS